MARVRSHMRLAVEIDQQPHSLAIFVEATNVLIRNLVAVCAESGVDLDMATLHMSVRRENDAHDEIALEGEVTP